MLKTSLRALIIVMLGAFAVANTAVAPAYAIQWSGSNGGDDTPFDLLALSAWRSELFAQPADAPVGEKLGCSIRDLTVQVTSFHGHDIAAEGCGFVVVL